MPVVRIHQCLPKVVIVFHEMGGARVMARSPVEGDIANATLSHKVCHVEIVCRPDEPGGMTELVANQPRDKKYYPEGMQRDTPRMIFGFSLLLILAGLAAAIALGKVEEKSSYGLMPLLTALATLAGSFAQWAFSRKDDPPKE